MLSPRTIGSFLATANTQSISWSVITKHQLLEYLLSEPEYTEYGAAELFPFEDGVFRSIQERHAFVHRNDLEKELFCRASSRNIDLNQTTSISQRALRDGCAGSTLHSSIRYRNVQDFRDYCMSAVFRDLPSNQDTVVLSKESASFFSEAWNWLHERNIDVLENAITDLWLLPLTSGRHRKIRPLSSPCEIFLAPTGLHGDFLHQLEASKASLHFAPLLQIGRTGLGSETLDVLTKATSSNQILQTRNANVMADFTH